jgi:hypothetical protein
VTDGCTLNDVGADGVTVESLSLQAADTNNAKIGSSAPYLGERRAIAHLARRWQAKDVRAK